MDILYWIYDWIADFLASMGLANKKGNLILIGLDNAGKTTLMGVLKNNHLKQSTPTGMPTREELIIDNLNVSCFDMGGHKEARRLWHEYFALANAIVYIVDAADKERIEESAAELQRVLLDPLLAEVPVLVLGNKIDIPTAFGEDDLKYQLGIIQTTTGKHSTAAELAPRNIRPLELFMCSVINRGGFKEGFLWLSQYF